METATYAVRETTTPEMSDVAYAVVEATHAMAETVVAAVKAISSIGEIVVVLVIGMGGVVGTAVGSVVHCTVWTGVFLCGSRLPGKGRH